MFQVLFSALVRCTCCFDCSIAINCLILLRLIFQKEIKTCKVHNNITETQPSFTGYSFVNMRSPKNKIISATIIGIISLIQFKRFSSKYNSLLFSSRTASKKDVTTISLFVCRSSGLAVRWPLRATIFNTRFSLFH